MQPDLSRYAYAVTYTPLPNEPGPKTIFQVPQDSFLIPQEQTTDPVATAAEAIRASTGRSTCILIPGSRFDAAGTRHGRGGGWYDRFLAAIPAEWLRVGVCTENEWSDTPLTREPWDEPVDFVVVIRPYQEAQFHRTHARPNMA